MLKWQNNIIRQKGDDIRLWFFCLILSAISSVSFAQETDKGFFLQTAFGQGRGRVQISVCGDGFVYCTRYDYIEDNVKSMRSNASEAKYEKFPTYLLINAQTNWNFMIKTASLAKIGR
jgi:hypothetical protein